MSIDRDTIINALHDVAKQYTPHTSDYLIQRFADRIMNEAAKARDTGSNAGMEAGDASPDEGIQRKQEGPVTRTSGDTTSPANHQPKDWRSMERLPVGEATTMLLSATADQPVDETLAKRIKLRIQQHKENHMLETHGEKGISFGVADRLTQQWEREAVDLTAELMAEILPYLRAPERESLKPGQIFPGSDPDIGDMVAVPINQMVDIYETLQKIVKKSQYHISDAIDPAKKEIVEFRGDVFCLAEHAEMFAGNWVQRGRG